MPHILHINDNNLLVQTTAEDGGEILQRSHGYAWLKGEQVIFDISANIGTEESPLAHCRVAPQQVNNRYWQQCAQTAIASNDAGMRHAADLIWKHLAELKTKSNLSELALVVPANYRDSHLQLLLGVAGANQLDVCALLSKPVLAAKQAGLSAGRALHIDVQLHQTVVSTLAVNDAEVSLQDIDTNTDIGIHSLQESLLHSLQASFIRADRFDPLHDADTEQQLFNQLPAIVAAGVNGEKTTVGVQHQGKLYSATIESSEILSALVGLSSLIQEHSAGAQATIVDTNAAFDVSKLASANGSANVIWASDPQALTTQLAVKKNAEGKVVYQTSLAHSPNTTNSTARSTTKATKVPASSATNEANVRSSSQPALVAHAADSAAVATHLMQFGLAVPIQQAAISTQHATLSLAQNAKPSDIANMLRNGDLHIVNDQQRKELRANDRVMSPLADGVITAVRVV